MAHPHWPLFDVEARTPTITLRYVDDELSWALADLAASGIHDPSWTPFLHPWTDEAPQDLGRKAMQFHWRCRAELAPEHWSLNFAVLVDDEVVGSTGLNADKFVVQRTFETGSWLGQAFQGKGIGKEMRAASLHIGFAGLGAQEATTSAFEDNAPSLGVTRSLGYEPNGFQRVQRRDELGIIHAFRMPRAHWESIRRDDIELTGVDAVLPILGL
jgi:RimJ/RimL family protein N-acetyltransferase